MVLQAGHSREIIQVSRLYFLLAPITELEPPTDTDPLLVGEVAMFTTTVRSVPAPEVTWMQQIIPVFTQLVPLVANGDSINVTLQNLSSTTYMSVLFLRVPEILPGAVIERYFTFFNNSFTTIGNPNDAAQLIRAGKKQPVILELFLVHMSGLLDTFLSTCSPQQCDSQP